MSYSITISEVLNNVEVSIPAANNIAVTNATYPITVSYNATVVEGAGAGLVIGGSRGQVLAKISSNDYDTEWITQVTISENEPQVPYIGQKWLNPTTQILKVYAATGWVQVTADDGQY
jgi:hypothetical protein